MTDTNKTDDWDALSSDLDDGATAADANDDSEFSGAPADPEATKEPAATATPETTAPPKTPAPPAAETTPPLKTAAPVTKTPPPKAEEPVATDHDPDDFVATYTVQDLLTDAEGVEYARGETLNVRCDRCALWKTPLEVLDGKMFCAPGQLVEVDVEGTTHSWPMAADRYSCRRHFVPRETDTTKILGLVSKSFGSLLALKWAFPTAKHVLKLQERIDAYYKKHLPEGDPDPAVTAALILSTSFYSTEQLEYVQPLIERFFDMAKAHKKAPKAGPRRKKTRLKKGSSYTWLHGEERIGGWVLNTSPKKKEVTLMVEAQHSAVINPDDPDAPCLVTYAYATWNDSAPLLVKEAVEFNAE